MRQKKSTRKALLSSAISLVLCLAMLIGTTFAWFTDSVTSSGNIIKSGNLKVSLEYMDGTKEVADIESDEWQDASQKAIFDYSLWEPGYVSVRHIKIGNEGSLALKYMVAIEANGEVSELADVIDVYYIDPAQKVADRTVLTDANKLGTLTEVLGKLDSTASGNLAAGKADRITIALKMQESAGNEYQDLSIGTDFSIKVFATQLAAENDSFGPDYDAGAYLPVIYKAEELESALENGESVKLGADLVLKSVIDIPTSTEPQVLDMNGYKITGKMDKNPDTSNTGLIVNAGNLTIKGDKNSVFLNSSVNGASLVYNTGTLIIDGGNYIGAERNAEGYPSYIVRNNHGGTVTVKGNANITSSWGAFSNYNKSVLNIEKATIYHDTDISGTTYYLMCAGSGATINVYDGEFTFNKPDANAMGAPILGVWDEGSKINVYGGSFDAEQGALNYSGKAIELFGGTFKNAAKKIFGGQTIEVYVAEGHVATDNGDGTWTVSRDYITVAAPSDNKSENGAALADIINNTTEASYVKLGEGEYKMPSIGGSKNVTIVGSKDTVIDATMGAYLDDSKVTFEGVTIKGSTGMANGNGSDYAAMYTPNVTYINCTFEGPFRVGRDGAKFINCTFNSLGNDYVWNMQNDTLFEGCTFNTEGKAILLYSDGPSGDATTSVVIKNCTFKSTKGAKAWAIANQNCAAIEIDNYGCNIELTTEGNTYDSNFSGEWRIKSFYSNGHAVRVNGTNYTTIAIDGKIMTIDSNRNVTVNN